MFFYNWTLFVIRHIWEKTKSCTYFISVNVMKVSYIMQSVLSTKIVTKHRSEVNILERKCPFLLDRSCWHLLGYSGERKFRYDDTSSSTRPDGKSAMPPTYFSIYPALNDRLHSTCTVILATIHINVLVLLIFDNKAITIMLILKSSRKDHSIVLLEKLEKLEKLLISMKHYGV